MGRREGSQEERPRLEAITCGLHLVSEDPRAPADGFHPPLSGWRGQGGSEHPLSTSPQAGLQQSSPILGHVGVQLCPHCARPSVLAGEPHPHLLTWGQVPGMLLLPGTPRRGNGSMSLPGPMLASKAASGDGPPAAPMGTGGKPLSTGKSTHSDQVPKPESVIHQPEHRRPEEGLASRQGGGQLCEERRPQGRAGGPAWTGQGQHLKVRWGQPGCARLQHADTQHPDCEAGRAGTSWRELVGQAQGCTRPPGSRVRAGDVRARGSLRSAGEAGTGASTRGGSRPLCYPNVHTHFVARTQRPKLQSWGFPGGSEGKAPACDAGDPDSRPKNNPNEGWPERHSTKDGPLKHTCKQRGIFKRRRKGNRRRAGSSGAPAGLGIRASPCESERLRCALALSPGRLSPWTSRSW